MAHTHGAHGGHAGHTGEHDSDVHHEASDVNIRAIFTFVIALLVVTAATYAVVWGVFVYLDRSIGREVSGRVYPLAVGQADRLPPEPRLQTTPRADLGDLREGERQLLESYSWVDRNAGVVRIPLEQAMRLTIERGLPTRETTR
jgi:hypothetical protein